MKMGMLKHSGIAIILGVLLGLAAERNANAISTVTVSSMDLSAGQQDVLIPVFVKNEVQLRALIMPLMIRKIGPAYVTKIGLHIGGRMVGQLNEIIFYRWYDTGTVDTSYCKRLHGEVGNPPTPGGYPPNSTFAVTADTTANVPKQVVTKAPYGVFWARNKLFGNNFAAGSDVTGSFIIDADIGLDEGCFEIDSTCMDPANHVLLADVNSFLVPATFASGAFHVGACSGIELGVPASVPETRRGPQMATLSWDAVENAIAYEVQIDETDNTFSNLTADVFVQGTSFSYTVSDEQSIHWRVRAAPKDCGYCFGPWAGPQQYTDVHTIATSTLPDSYTLDQNYPNPFNASTVIQFTTKRDGNVKLDVYNILGQDVATLVNEFKPVGTYSVTWDGADSHGNVVPSGMYFYRVSTADFTAVKKMTLLK